MTRAQWVKTIGNDRLRDFACRTLQSLGISPVLYGDEIYFAARKVHYTLKLDGVSWKLSVDNQEEETSLNGCHKSKLGSLLRILAIAPNPIH